VLRRRARHGHHHRTNLKLRGPLLLALTLSSCAAVPERPSGVGVVTRIVDGDTVDVEIAGVRERVRLIGIDTPEIAHGEDPAECGGAEAARFLESVIPPGTEVSVMRDVVSRDHYGRLLGYLAKEDVMVNLQIAAAGYARTLRIAPNVRLSAEISNAVDAARRARLGIWSACV